MKRQISRISLIFRVKRHILSGYPPEFTVYRHFLRGNVIVIVGMRLHSLCGWLRADHVTRILLSDWLRAGHVIGQPSTKICSVDYFAVH